MGPRALASAPDASTLRFTRATLSQFLGRTRVPSVVAHVLASFLAGRLMIRIALAAFAAAVSLVVVGVVPVAGATTSRETAFHLRLTKSEPAKDQAVAAPSVIRLWFSLAPELAVTSIKLSDASGTSVALSAVRRANAAGAPVEADVTQALAPGRYTVTWKTSSRDGHPIKGDFTFTVRAGAQ